MLQQLCHELMLDANKTLGDKFILFIDAYKCNSQFWKKLGIRVEEISSKNGAVLQKM